MSEGKKSTEHAAALGSVHPHVTVAVMLAMGIYSSRFHDIQADRLEQLIAAACETAGHDVPVEHQQSLVHMATAALLFGVWIQRVAMPDQFREMAHTAEIDARLRVAMTDGAIASLAAHASAL